MSGRTAAELARSVDKMTNDLAPTCPRCGDLCYADAIVCPECGVRLFPGTWERPERPDEV